MKKKTKEEKEISPEESYYMQQVRKPNWVLVSDTTGTVVLKDINSGKIYAVGQAGGRFYLQLL